MTAAAKNNLLVELFVEELPPKSLKKLGDEFARLIADGLRAQGLAAADAPVTPYATPRRLAVHVRDVLARAADRAVSHKLMPVSVGLAADGQPTAALVKKLAALGFDASAVPALKRQGEGKSETLFLDTTAEGATLAEGLQRALSEAVSKLPIPKVMRYQLDDGWSSVDFVRPAHGLVALHGGEVVDVSVLGLAAGRITQGHRFEARVDAVSLAHADRYAEQMLEEGAVIAGFEARRDEIARQLKERAGEAGGTPVDDPALLDEVTALVERPNVLAGQFEDAFLQVPQECLILTMKANQKYFPLLDASGRLTHRFLLVSNIRPADASAVVGGNERVVRPRLADARFFYDQDRRKTLASRVSALDKVVYHGKLGTQGERMQRVRRIAQAIGERMGGPALAAQAEQAATLAKTDLLTDMVGEFPELQGTMGRYYALNDGLDAAVADAIEDHYRPRFAGDVLPRGDAGVALALADKLETLVGLFGIGQLPSGDKDPFALRRHALGVIRMLVERELPLPIGAMLDESFAAFPAGLLGEGARAAVEDFLMDRLATYLRERGYTASEVDAVVSMRPQRIDTITRQLEAVRAFQSLPEAASLAAANKRVGNILKKAEEPVAPVVNASLLNEPAEARLNEALAAAKPVADAAFERGDYTASLQALAALKAPVDSFFDDVMVNAEDPALRANRLGLLAMLHAAMNRVADLSKLAA